MASKAIEFAAALAVLALGLGCVSVRNDNGLTPPSALCSHVRATIGLPKGSVCLADLKSGRANGAVHVKEWFFSGVSAGLLDMALCEAKEKGGLTKVHYADYEQISYLGFVTVFNLIAYGE